MTLKNKFVVDKINQNFDLSPRRREMLQLNKPIYEKTAAYGHFEYQKMMLPSGKDDKTNIFKNSFY